MSTVLLQGYKVFYTLNPSQQISLWTMVTVDNNNLRLTTISNLEVNQTYTICVLAFTSVGDGPLSETIRVKTQQGGKYDTKYTKIYIMSIQNSALLMAGHLWHIRLDEQF